jgi:hypothetical protein
MERSQCSKVKSILTLPRQVNVDLVKDAIAEICLLEQGTLDRVTVALWE